ncbi:MAG: type III pantothenate kinase [Cyanobacteria bacterium SZAS LIN-2]|nr:type III pantothenate kinase [Cyanobacteria bacterium SZAS LIN-3]MBS1997064.1 type III pantothenate kinase [Cyanobacteria bacterium SZAS LIN-2]MBS2010463.1 type III pantothenate kinase [Cyanobacteria bacterium SZAS TMP-1]
MTVKNKLTLAVDIGNSRISCGLFNGDELADTYNYSTSEPQVAASHLKTLSRKLDGALISLSSVVPGASEGLLAIWKPDPASLFQVSAKNQTLLSGLYETIGSDRIANAAAAFKHYTVDCPAAVVIDFGTATTLTAVSREGDFLGGMITLGLAKIFYALHWQTAQLPELSVIEWDSQASPLAFDTERAIERGCVIGHIGLVKYWVERAKENLPAGTRVVATGGLAPLIAPAADVFDAVDVTLTLKGIKIIAEEARARVGQG